MNRTCVLRPFRDNTPPPGLALTATVSRQMNVVAIQYSLLGQITQADQAIEVAISAVLEGRDGQPTYWALAHCGPQADFHRRESFIVEL